MDKSAVVDVIDIRKRIEKIRNEVSEAIVSQTDFHAQEEHLREDISLEIMPSGEPPAQRQNTQNGEATLPLDFKDKNQIQDKATHRAMTQMMAMPSFTLNVKNRQSSPLLIGLFGVQLITNIVLIIVILTVMG